jgi:hypothetical protein
VPQLPTTAAVKTGATNGAVRGAVRIATPLPATAANCLVPIASSALLAEDHCLVRVNVLSTSRSLNLGGPYSVSPRSTADASLMLTQFSPQSFCCPMRVMWRLRGSSPVIIGSKNGKAKMKETRQACNSKNDGDNDVIRTH